VKAVARSGPVAFWLFLSLRGLAIVLMAATEVGSSGMAVFLLVWAMLNCLWLALVRRPSVATLISLELPVALVLFSGSKIR
jgi:hypothetical protein